MDAQFRIMNFVLVVCMVCLLCCLNISEAKDCKDKPIPCPGKNPRCYCPGQIKVEFRCVNGQWRPLPCGIPTTPDPTCPKLQAVPFTDIKYSSVTSSYNLPLGTTAEYKCPGESHSYYNTHTKKYTRECTKNGWNGKEPPINICSCRPPLEMAKPKPVYDHQPYESKYERLYPFRTIATYYCNITGLTGKEKCKNTGQWKWTGSKPQRCKPITKPRIITNKNYYKTTTSKSPIHHNEERTVVIVSGTTGAILGALIVLVVIVSCQRRIHYHRVRRARIRHRQDQDAFTAFITYHRDVRLMLPSYDEAINQQEQGQPPSFEEALGHYEEPTLPPGHPPAGENPPSISTDSPTSSASPGSETRSPPENNSDTAPLFDRPSLVSPTSENSRFFRSLRTLFGGRAFRPDAIYCRFVPEEDGSESSARREERESRNNATEDDLTEVLAQAGLY